MFLIVIFIPRYWVSNAFVSRELDKLIRKQIKNKEKIFHVDYCTINCGGIFLWGANYPYAYGYYYNTSDKQGRLPSRRTRILLRDYIKESSKCQR